MERLAHRFAARDGKSTLYKFRPFATPEDQQRVTEILIEHRVYFARASQLNDPFDMSPRMEMPTRESLLAGAGAFWDRTNPPAEERKRLAEYFKTCDLATHRCEAEGRARRRVEDGYPVFSLAGNRDHPMLWSHYAGGHKGLCIHFHANEEAIFGAALGVEYNEARSLLPIELRSLSEKEIFARIALHKGEFWAYEDEYRFPRFPDMDYSGIPIKFDGQFAHFRPSELSGVTVGVRMAQAQIETVVEIATAHVPKLPVWRAVESDGFAFDFEQIV